MCNLTYGCVSFSCSEGEGEPVFSVRDGESGERREAGGGRGVARAFSVCRAQSGVIRKPARAKLIRSAPSLPSCLPQLNLAGADSQVITSLQSMMRCPPVSLWDITHIYALTHTHTHTHLPGTHYTSVAPGHLCNSCCLDHSLFKTSRNLISLSSFILSLVFLI